MKAARWGLIVLLAQLGFIVPVQAATLGDLGLSESQARALEIWLKGPVISPGISFGSPVGFGLDFGELAASIGGSTLPESQQDSVGSADGSMALAFGLGDAQRFAGLETTINLISLREGFAEDGNFGVKLHTAISRYRIGFAVGVEGVEGWGAADDQDRNVYGVVTKFFNLMPNRLENPVPMSINVGVGNGRFRDLDADGVGVFGGIAVLPHPQFSIIADWTGRDLNAGVSVVPVVLWPFIVTVGAVNLTEQDDQSVEFAAGIGYRFTFN